MFSTRTSAGARFPPIIVEGDLMDGHLTDVDAYAKTPGRTR